MRRHRRGGSSRHPLGDWLHLERAAHLLAVRPTRALARGLAAFDDRVLHRAVLAGPAVGLWLARLTERRAEVRVDGRSGPSWRAPAGWVCSPAARRPVSCTSTTLRQRWGDGFWAGVWLPENEFGHWDGLRVRQARRPSDQPAA